MIMVMIMIIFIDAWSSWLIFFPADEQQVITGTMFIRSPEMILEYPHTDTSTDMWWADSIIDDNTAEKDNDDAGHDDEKW